jgi:hypothetical protein
LAVRKHGSVPEVGDLLKGDVVITVTSDPNDIVTELSRIGLGHVDVLPAHPSGASKLRCHLFMAQTPPITKKQA